MGDQADQSSRIRAVAHNLRFDAATGEVVRAFDSAGISTVLLKGPALSAWDTEARERTYLDCDLWIKPADVAAAAVVMAALGFRQRGGAALAEWWEEHASVWVRDDDAVVVDLHRQLQGVGVDAETAWAVMGASTEIIAVGDYPTRIFSVAGRALYVTLHAAHHGQGWPKALSHVERALASVDDATWQQAADLATELDALDAFSTGLRLIPEGAALAGRLSLPPNRSVKVALQATTPPPVALGLERLAHTEGFRNRFALLVSKVFPPPSFVRKWWPRAARNRRMLIVGYLYRPVWLVRSTPRAFRAWRIARRSVR